MFEIKSKTVCEYQKCGEIMFAAKLNKIAINCNFCQQLFKQLQAFTRHLQMEHKDKIKFVKQMKEVEVYAVEELLNQTPVSCANDMENDNSDMAEGEDEWLSENDLKWLDEGVEPEELEHDKQTILSNHEEDRNKNDLNFSKNIEEGLSTSILEALEDCEEKEESKLVCNDKEHNMEKAVNKEDDDLSVTNTSILKALEDCDVSFNLMNNFNSTNYSESEKESNLKNTLLQENQNYWSDIDSNDTELMGANKANNKILKCKKIGEDLQEVTNKSLNKTEENSEQSQIKGVKSLLQDIDDLDDVDILLHNLENEINNYDKLEERYSNTLLVKNCKTGLVLNGKMNIVSLKERNLVNEIFNISHDQCGNLDVEAFEKNKRQTEPNCVYDFETRLKELENALDEDILNSTCNVSKAKISKELTDSSDLITDKKTALDPKLNNLKESFTLDTTVDGEISPNKAKVFCTDFENELYEIKEPKIVKGNETVSQNEPLNEDLTKALVDALDCEDLDLLNLQLEDENEEPLNGDILDLLERELTEIGAEDELPEQKPQQQMSCNTTTGSTLRNDPSLTRLKIISTATPVSIGSPRKAELVQQQQQISSTNSTFNNILMEKEALALESKKLNNNQTNQTSKYQKTNFKARTKKGEVFDKSAANVYKSLIMKETNSIAHEQKAKPLKGNHEIFIDQQQIFNSSFPLKSPLKSNMLDITNQKISPNSHIYKTPNKENIRNSKTDKFSFSTSFIETERGSKTPIKRDQMFFKQSPKTQEKSEFIESNITPKQGEKTPKTEYFKQQNITPKYGERNPNLHNFKQQNLTPTHAEKIQKVNSFKYSPETEQKYISPKHGDKIPIQKYYKQEIIRPKQIEKSPYMQNGKRSPKISQENIGSRRGEKTPTQQYCKVQKITPEKNGQEFRRSPKAQQQIKTPNHVDKTDQNFKLSPGNQQQNTTPKHIEKTCKEQIIKQSPVNKLRNTTTDHGGKTEEKQHLKQTPEAQEKHGNSYLQQTQKTSPKTPPLNSNQIRKSPRSHKKSIETLQNGKTQTIQNPKNLLHSKEDSKKSPIEVSNRRSTENPSTPTKSPADISNFQNNANTLLSTPSQRLKNVTVKLQRFTPDKLAKAPELKANGNCVKQGANHIKLPQGITLTVIKNTQTNDVNQCEIIETPIRASTYCKQNFTESSLRNTSQVQTEQNSNTDKQSSSATAQCNARKTLQKNSNSARLRQRMASIDIIANNEETSRLPNKTPRHSHLDYKSYAVNRSHRKKEILQRMHNIKKQIFKAIEKSDNHTILKNMQPPLIKQKKRPNIHIQNVTILPTLEKEAMTLPIFNDFKKPHLKESTSPTLSSTSPKDLVSPKNSIKCNKPVVKRRATSPLLGENDLAKRQHISPNQKQNAEKTFEVEKTQLDLSESCVEPLQNGLKANHLSLESLLNLNMSEDDSTSNNISADLKEKDETIKEKEKDDEVVINDLLEQVENEKPLEEKSGKENSVSLIKSSVNRNFIEDFNDSSDIELLAKFGLKIIKLPDIEDAIFLEEQDEMKAKAKKFANIYRYYPKIWSTKSGENQTFKNDLVKSFNGLLAEANSLFNVELNIVNIKRLVNLITFWVAQNICGRLIDKRKISDSTHRYLSYFSYIPKTIKRFYYCEFCEEYFNTEHKYFTHRIIHTGAFYPYNCQKCQNGFRVLKQLKNHESICNKEKIKTSPTIRLLKCINCELKFENSELLNEHNKTHLKNLYRCSKCGSTFASVADVEKHMNICNTATKRLLQPLTPRPAKKIQNKEKNEIQ